MTKHKHGTNRRTRSLGTRLNDADYQHVMELLRHGQSPGEWLRDVVIERIDSQPFQELLLQELVVLRIITLNFIRAYLAGERLTFDVAKGHMECAEQQKMTEVHKLMHGGGR